MKEEFSDKCTGHFVKLLPCNIEKCIDFNSSNIKLANLMTSSNKNSTIQPHHIVLNNVNTCNAITINTSPLQNNNNNNKNNNVVPSSSSPNVVNALPAMGGDSRSPSLQQEPLKAPTVSTSGSNGGSGESKVIYTSIPIASIGKTVTPILPNNLQQQQQGTTTLSGGIKASSVGTASFISLQDLKSYPNIITTVVDSSTLQQQQQTQNKIVCNTSSTGTVLASMPQTSLAIPLRQGVRIVPHGTSIGTSPGGGTIQATLKRNPNSDLENPIITKVIITNTPKSISDVSGLNQQQDGSKTVTTTLTGQKPTGTFLLASPSKPLTITSNPGGEGTSSSTATLTLSTPIVVKSFPTSANASKKILLKPSPGLFNLNKLSPDKKGELASLAAGSKLQCIKLVTSTPTKCNSDGSKPMMIGKVKPITELSSSGNLPQPTVVSLQKQICQVSKPGQRFLVPAPALRQPTPLAGQQQPAMIRTVEPNLVTFSPQTAQALQNIVMVPTQYISPAGTGNTGQMVIQSLATATTAAPNQSAAQPSTVKKVVNIQPKYPPGYQPQPIAPHTSANSSTIPSHTSQPQTQPSQQTFTNGVSSESTNPNDPRPRKPCNCTKSQCLKLYCDCFANGEFCNMCNCTNCYNNLEHEEERQKAIKACLDRNPLAFHPKIGKSKNGDHERRHTKGCNCKRSGCLKNYCECYEAKILCTNLCKCVGCKNFEDSCERKTLMHLADAAEVRVQQQAAAKTKLTPHIPLRPPALAGSSGERLPFALITDEVIEATTQCLLAQAEDGEKSDLPISTVERLILEEFGRCLMQIIDCSNKTKN